MSYKTKFDNKTKPFGMSDETWSLIQDAVASGKDVEWEHSSFTDPGDDWNKVLVDGKAVFHQDGF